MRLINGLSNSPNMQIALVLDNGNKAQLNLYYFETQKGWYYSLNYNNGQWQASLRRLVTSPNMLQSQVDIIPFGIAVTTKGGLEPVGINDLSDGTTQIYLLNETEILEVEAGLSVNAN